MDLHKDVNGVSVWQLNGTTNPSLFHSSALMLSATICPSQHQTTWASLGSVVTHGGFFPAAHWHVLTRLRLLFVSAAGKWLACQSMDNQILIFGAQNRFRLNKKKIFKGHMVAGYACQVDFSPDMRSVYSSDCHSQPRLL